MGRMRPALGQARALDVGNQEAEGVLSPALPAASFSLAACLPTAANMVAPGVRRRPAPGPTWRPGERQCGPVSCTTPGLTSGGGPDGSAGRRRPPLKHVVKVGTGLSQNEASARLDKRQSRCLSIICVCVPS